MTSHKTRLLTKDNLLESVVLCFPFFLPLFLTVPSLWFCKYHLFLEPKCGCRFTRLLYKICPEGTSTTSTENNGGNSNFITDINNKVHDPICYDSGHRIRIPARRHEHLPKQWFHALHSIKHILQLDTGSQMIQW